MALALVTSFVFDGATLVFGHGDRQHTTAAAVDTSTTATPETTARVNWDSVYAGIQKGFVAVKPIFVKGCFDCHSRQTRYPWYYRLPGIRQLIDSDIRNAHRHCDMTNGFPFAGHGRPADDLDAIRAVIRDGDMPPGRYRLMHWNARPDRAETDSLNAWLERGLALLAAHGQAPRSSPGGPSDE